MRTEQVTVPVDMAKTEERIIGVKVLTIGTKQVTQSLYKQLQCQEVIDGLTCEFRGKVWGWVNLHVDCNQEKSHIHAIWENEGVLMRSCTSFECYQAMYKEDKRILTELAEIAMCLNMLDGDEIERVVRVGKQTVYPKPPAIVEIGLRNFERDFVEKTVIEHMHSIIRRMNDGYRWKYEWADFNPDKERPKMWHEMERISADMTIEEQKWRRDTRLSRYWSALHSRVGVWK